MVWGDRDRALVRTQITVFRAYLEEHARARLTSARVMHALVTCTALTFGACVVAQLAHRMSIERLTGEPASRFLVASIDLSAPPKPELEWPDPDPPIYDGLDSWSDEHSLIPSSPPRTPTVEAEPRHRRARYRAPPEQSRCYFPDLESKSDLCVSGAACSAVRLGLHVPSPPPVPVPLYPAIRSLTPLPLMPEHAPDPSTRALERTFTGQRNRHDGTVEIVIDVDHSGQVVDARVDEGFADDPQIDAIVLQTVKYWRFRSWLEDEAHTKRTTIRFEIEFEPSR